MSGSTIGGVVGAVVGFFIPGVGPQMGWMIGSAIGGYVDPTQVYGPRLSDTRGQTSQVGGAIPRAWGTAPVPGNIIWQQPGVTEHEHTDDGKGSGTEQVTYTYTRSYAIMFHLGEIAGVLQIKRNGKIVYDARDEATLLAEYEAAMGPLSSVSDWTNRVKLQAAMNARFMNRCRIYTGTQTQEPDPTIESYEGVGNVNAYRGRAYMVVTDDETQAGEIAQYEIVVAVCGTVNTQGGDRNWLLVRSSGSGTSVLKESPDGLDWGASWQDVPLDGGGLWTPATSTQMLLHNSTVLAVSSSAGGLVGGAPAAFLGSDGVWRGLDSSYGSISAEQGRLVRSVSNWFVCDQSGGIKTAAQPTALSGWSTIGLTLPDGCAIGNRVLFAFATGAGPDPVEFRHTAADGTDAVDPGTINVGYIARSSTIFSDGSTALLTLQEQDGLGSWRVHLHSSADIGEAWTDLGAPFPWSSGAYDPRKVNGLYDAVLGRWFIASHTRVAFGASPSGIVLDPFVFPNEIRCIASDGEKVLVGGDGGMLYAWTPAGGWQALSSGTTGVILSLVSVNPLSGTAIPDAPGFYVRPDGQVVGPSSETITPCSTTTVGEIIADLCELSGLTSGEYDVSQLTDTLNGYVVARETDAASVIESLRPIGMFDPAEWDGKFRGVKRGGTAVGSINGDDLVERDGDAFERELVQEAELLRKVSVGYLDTDAAWAPNTQAWERRVGTINARGESVVEVSAVFGADQGATIAKRKGLASWGEPEKQKFSLPYRLAKYTPTDILNYTDADAEVHQIRLMQVEDDSGIRYVESAANCAEAYNATASGAAPRPPTITDGSLRGPTYAAYMNLPSLRTQDNVPGICIAACGLLPSWAGASIMLSADDGVSYQQVTTINTPSTMGRLSANCTDSSEPIAVTLNEGALSSITDEQLALRQNAFAIVTNDVAELGQFKTATATGADAYDLTDVARNLLDTGAQPHVVGDPFVMVSTAKFVPLDIGLAGKTLYFKAVTFGTSEDAAEAVPFVFNPLFSSVVVEPYTDDNGINYTDDADNTYYYEASA